MASAPPKEMLLRWSLAQAAREFGVAKESLRRKLVETRQEPGVDGLFSTKQLIAGLYGDLCGAKLRTQNEQAEKLRIENEISRGELLNRRELMRGFTQIADAISSHIMSCTELPRRAREDILRDLASWPIVLEETADRQTRLPGRRNGKGLEEDGSEN